MYYYVLYGLLIKSDIEIMQLVAQTEDEKKRASDLVIKKGKFPDELKREKTCYSEINTELAYISNNTCWLLMKKGKELVYELKEGGPGCHPEYLTAYILGWGMAIIMHQLGRPAIHCSAVSRIIKNEDGREEKVAVFITGRSGAGKSTITSLFLENGWGLMADDVAPVEIREDQKAFIYPAFPYQKLCRDAALDQGYDPDELIYIDEEKDKFLVKYEGEFSTEPVHLIAAVFLAKATSESELTAEEIKGAAKLPACINANFLKPLMPLGKQSPEYVRLCLNIAKEVPFFGIIRPEGKDTREEIWSKISQFIGGLV